RKHGVGDGHGSRSDVEDRAAIAALVLEQPTVADDERAALVVDRAAVGARGVAAQRGVQDGERTGVVDAATVEVREVRRQQAAGELENAVVEQAAAVERVVAVEEADKSEVRDPTRG